MAKFKLGEVIRIQDVLVVITEISQKPDGFYYSGEGSDQIKESEVKELYRKVATRRPRSKKIAPAPTDS